MLFLFDGILEGRREVVWCRNFFEFTIADYRSHFRMSQHTGGVRGYTVHSNLPQYNNHRGQPPVELRNQILLNLWILRNPECLRVISERNHLPDIPFANPSQENALVTNLKNPDLDLFRSILLECGYFGFMMI